MWVVVSDTIDYLLKTEKQLNDTSTYKGIEFKEKKLPDLIESNDKMFLGLKAEGLISQKGLQ